MRLLRAILLAYGFACVTLFAAGAISYGITAAVLIVDSTDNISIRTRHGH